MLHIAGKFSDIRQLSTLLGSPGLERPANGGDERQMVHEESELASFQEVPEVADVREGGEQLSVECRVILLRAVQFPG